jgi:hypothetical protein
MTIGWLGRFLRALGSDAMTVNFRQRARDALDRAKVEIASNDSERLKYAALELRMAIEAVTYERAQSYRDELPPSAYETWQPKKLMQVLLEIEPRADKSSSIAFGREDVPGEPAKQMTFLGSEQVFGLKAIKGHYDALGSYLHSPTLKQLEEKGSLDINRLKERCEEIVAALDAVLTSRVFNINFGNFTSIECMNSDCGRPIRKRHPHGVEVLAAKCYECNAEYEITADANGEWLWRPMVEEVSCPSESCGEVIKLWKHEIKSGSHWRCQGCSNKFQLGLAIFQEQV